MRLLIYLDLDPLLGAPVSVGIKVQRHEVKEGHQGGVNTSMLVRSSAVCSSTCRPEEVPPGNCQAGGGGQAE
eukprot:scaffold41117_cov21-Tisochrysis_lutea.AAC.3